MSVLSCNRNGCENVMCDRYSYTFGYLCDECFEELVQKGVGTDIRNFLEDFHRQPLRIASESYFNCIFEKR